MNWKLLKEVLEFLIVQVIPFAEVVWKWIKKWKQNGEVK